VFVSEIQYAQTVAAEQEWRDEAGMTEAERDAEIAEQMAELEDSDSHTSREFAAWLMEPGRHRICNGHDLTEAMEDGDKQEEFLNWKAGK